MTHQPVSSPLMTRWGKALDPDNPLPEYPRPQLVRPRWQNLNGRWQYAITDGLGSQSPAEYDGEIIVPFSPESELSGVRRHLGPDQVLWYRRTIQVDRELISSIDAGRLLLHFGAVDQECEVFAGGVSVGRHSGGYLPFTCDVTDAINAGELDLMVRVTDCTDAASHSRGKQRTKRGGIWYTPQSGIWQTVWLEHVPISGIEKLTLVPHVQTGEIEVTVHTYPSGQSPQVHQAEVRISSGGAEVGVANVPVNKPTRITIPEPLLWSPENPHLYDMAVTAGQDQVQSYFAMRSFGTGTDADGAPRLLLNGSPYFHAGILDQGYWPDGLLTQPSDEAFIYDLELLKDSGFTMVRMHIKVAPMRWYHHCDRLGLLVWQDMINGGTPYKPAVVTAPVLTPLRLPDTGARMHRLFGRADAAGRKQFEEELRAMIEHLRSVPSIAVWVPFNEGWGQFNSAAVAREVKELDPTRVIDHASGWHDQGAGDLRSIHRYFRRFRVPRNRHLPQSKRADTRVLVLSEYGGYSLKIAGHTFNDSNFGYKHFKSTSTLTEAFVRLHEKEIVPAIKQGLSATVYTQVSDVEDELNGLVTYDREVEKIPREILRRVNAKLRFIYND